MNAEFLRFYEQELAILYERAEEFAEEFPGIAERLGGLTREKVDPGIAGLLEGCAFMAARVQLKLDSEFSTFTTELLERLMPDYLAPTPSAILVEARPNFSDDNLTPGKRFPEGSVVDTVYVESERRVSCHFRLSRPLFVAPLRVETAEYLTSPAALQALGLEVRDTTLAGLRLTITRRPSPNAPSDKTAKTSNENRQTPLSGVKTDDLPFFLWGNFGDAVNLYEQLFAHLTAISVRYVDPFGNPRFMRLEPHSIEQIGFGESPIFGEDDRMPSGFALLRSFFAFPNAYLGFRLTRLKRILERLDVPQADFLFEFDEIDTALAPRVDAGMFRLNAAPAVNLFEMTCSRIRLKQDRHEYQVVPDVSRWIDFEPYRVTKVEAIYPGEKEKVPVYPLYAAPPETVPLKTAHYYSVRRMPRLRTERERRFGQRAEYLGSDLFLIHSEPANLNSSKRARELSVRAVCTNRHLPDQLPMGSTGAELDLVDDTSISLDCISGPTRPRESIVVQERSKPHERSMGTVLWRLINALNFNHHGISRFSGKDAAGAVREILALFSDMNDLASDRRLRGIVGIACRPISRRLRQPDGFNAARGIEITVTLDENAFEGTGIMLLGALLDRFFADYSSINSFTETVITSRQRGLVKRWPPRSGTGPVL
ncbi:type VI secretion system baseplate subunit TssF [Fulvimarina sp. MAC3]|uniref:type VI secretion system baseplate subunit TssF n=1 Tax=Fulvimarina sp. MAC3 TaxID=3148887 RepID=UPI0031FC062B